MMKLHDIIKKTSLFILISAAAIGVSLRTFAAQPKIDISGNVYEFDAKETYPFSTATATGITTSENIMGTLKISGAVQSNGTENGVQSYVVSSGNIDLLYNFNAEIVSADETEWHLVDDKSKKIDSVTLDNNILSGAVVVQSSNDGEKWFTDVQVCDAFDSENSLKESFYTTKDVQLENGCYYRIIVVYKMEIKTGEKKVAFVTADTREQKRCAEIYEFYAVSSETEGNTTTAADTPRKVIASESINTGKDNGYSGEEPIDKDDPHFGWKLGEFVINGYTRETTYDGTPVYLKNVGDKVTLWFTLEQDITCLNADSTLTINQDKNGYDQAFGIEQTDFGHGTLIISYTDYQGSTHDPIIYTDFLAANARTGADTRVQLFEEGDYEVALDYEIKNNPRQVGPISLVPTYTDYKMTFSFSIRNGNCMVYPFDISTENELNDGAITTEGFKLDMARSRYLNIDVEKTTVSTNSDGRLEGDVRFNRPAKDGDDYTEEGIYKFTVSNLYTGEKTTKTIYVGTNKYLNALSKNGFTIDMLNEKIAEGYSVENDGTLTALAGEIESALDTETKTDENSIIGEEAVNAVEVMAENDISEEEDDNDNVTEKQTQSEGTLVSEKTERKDDGSVIPFVIVGLVAVGVIGTAVGARKRNRKKGDGAE